MGVAPTKTVTQASTVRQADENRSARIEALRALAALGVVANHVFTTSLGLTAGVEVFASPIARLATIGTVSLSVFFALSGYLIFWPFVRRDFMDGAPLRLGRYYANRALRVLPLYIVAGLILWLAAGRGVRIQ